MKRDIQYRKCSTRVASRLAKRLKTQDLRKSVNIREMLILGGYITQYPASPPEIKLSLQESKKVQNLIPNCSCPVQFHWISLFCSQYFAQDYLNKQIFGLKLAESSSKFDFLRFSMLSKHLSNTEDKKFALESVHRDLLVGL